jgi:ABC-2 type transport system ATP-binding protein
VGILRGGELVAQDSIEGLRDARGGDTRLVVTVAGAVDGSLETVRALDGVTDATLEERTLTVSCSSDAKTRVISALEADGVTVEDFKTEEASLEDLFLRYTDDADADADTDADDEPTPSIPDAETEAGR